MANVRLHAGPHYSLEVGQPEGRTDKNGQFVLAVDHSQNNPDDLFEQVQLAEEAGDTTEAERLYRLLMKSDPTEHQHRSALETSCGAVPAMSKPKRQLRAATLVDPTFADAWYNLSDSRDEQGRSEAAIESLRTALRVAPDYADAMFNLALLLQRKNQYPAAADYWCCYLASDARSEGGGRARRSLKFCEIQVNLIASA